MNLLRLCLLMLLLLVGAAALAVSLGETPLSLTQYGQALSHPASPPGEVLWTGTTVSTGVAFGLLIRAH